MKLVTSVCRRVVLMELPLSRLQENLPAPAPLEFRELGPAEGPLYHALRPRQDAAFQRRLERGDRCFAVSREDRVVATGWVATKQAPVPYLGAELVLGPGECFLYDGYTTPELRRTGAYRTRILLTLSGYQERGFHRALCVVATENRISLASARSLGFEVIGLYGWWRGPGRRRWDRPRDGKALLELVPTP